MEFCWFAICTILAFIPWISAEEKLLYQTPIGNLWGGWEATTNGLSSFKVIKLVFVVLFSIQIISIPFVKEQLSYGGHAGCIIVSLPHSQMKDTPVGRAPLLKYNGLLRESLPKTGPLRFGSENRFPLNFAHEYILVQK